MERNKLRSFGQWQLVKALGTGAFGEVFYYKNRESGKEIAIKRLKANPKLRPDELHILQKRWSQECKWMQNLRTNYIVGGVKINDINFLNYLAEQNNAELSFPVIIMEYCNGGDLRKHLNKIENSNGLKENDVRYILHALLRAIEYLHNERNIEHRDIKPENIVLHIKGNEKFYKLTDFGYAREISETTVAQSVVGTRNYVAPEVIDPGNYTKTVDYWSIGILAYEIMCGVHPFIPHETFVNRLKNIKRKSYECIAIIQNIGIGDTSLGHFEFINSFTADNHLSSIFVKDMEKWLRLALDTNYKTRGCENNDLKFYSYLDDVLKKKILTVFSLKTFRKYYYDVESYENLDDFYEKICSDNQTDVKNIFFILPLLHPKELVQKPVDYFVQEWCDTSNPDNPPVMLYVTEFFIQTDCDVDCDEYFTISETIKLFMNLSADDDDNVNIPIWLLQQFEKDVHFVLSESQNILECYITGLHKFIIEVEDKAFKRKTFIDELLQRALQLSGYVKHSNFVLNECLHFQKEKTVQNMTIETFNTLTLKCQELGKLAFMLKATYKEILQKCKELARSEIYEQYMKSDIFELSKYRNFISFDYSIAERIENAQKSFDKCFFEFRKFIKCREMKNIRACIHEQIKKFQFVCQSGIDLNNRISNIEYAIENFTRSLLKNITSDKLSLSMSSLHIDGPKSVTILNDPCSLSDFDMDSKLLIDECQTLCNAMEISMDMN